MNCNRMENQLIGYLIGTLNEEQRGSVEQHIFSCGNCKENLENLKKARSVWKKWDPLMPPYDFDQIQQNILTNVRAQKLIEEKSSQESLFITAKREKTKTQMTRPKTRSVSLLKAIINYKIPAFASAIIIIIGIVLGLNFIDKLSTPSVAWDKLVERIESIDFYTFKSKIYTLDIHKPFIFKQITKYYISKYGIRWDFYYPSIDYDMINYTSWSDKTSTFVFPKIKKYTRTFFTDERINRLDFLDDPRLFIKLVMSFKYKKLGNKIIDGKKAQGIEINSPKFGKMGFESCLARIWVEIDTNLPILLEIEATSGHGMVETKIVIDAFEWNGEYDSSLFEPNLSGYSLVAEAEILPMNKESTIKALRRFSQVADGKYPSRLSQTNNLVISLYYKLFKEKGGEGFLFWEEEDFDWEGYLSLHSQLRTAGMFYAELFNNDNEVAYYGDKVTADDLDLPLMRWKISNDKYRVIFGDLRIEDVSSAQLAELESALNK